MDQIFFRAMTPLFLAWTSLAPMMMFMGVMFDKETTFIAQIASMTVSMLVSLAIGSLLKKVGEKMSFLICASVYTVGILLLIIGAYLPESWVNAQWCNCLALGLVGFMQSAINTIPFMYIGKMASSSSKGLYFGIFNCVIVIGQALANILLAIINAIKNDTKNTMWLAMVFSAFTVMSTFALKNPVILTKKEMVEGVSIGIEHEGEMLE